MGKIVKAESSKDFKGYASAELVEGRVILDVSYCAGSYGMGGYGFLGFKMEATISRPEEWLVCTLWSADNWATVAGRWLASHPAQYQEQKPLNGYIQWRDDQGRATLEGERWDEFKPMVLNQELKKFECDQRWCKLTIGETLVEIEENPHIRPISYGSKEPRELEEDDDLR